MGCITEILKMKGDKEFFKFLDMVIEGGALYKDHEYLIILNSLGHRCGYVAINSKEDKRIEPDDIDCHGGITFYGDDHVIKNLLNMPCSDKWIGFDCGHYNNQSDLQSLEKYHNKIDYKEWLKDINTVFEGSVKTFEYAEKECKSIIEQLIIMDAEQL